MTDIALRTTNLGKRYRIGGARENNATLRDAIVRTARRPIERIRNPGSVTHRSEDLWALRGVDLEVREGETLGIIGSNGAGKSTLLKVLSHITEPTEGKVDIFGRVGSLLEVGTGFHPELTGRENIMLNGAILGMTRTEIRSRFDEIVEFSEIGKFLDTPVKRYSSGMYVRLAFSVAAHLNPEILIVDEVLSVGDAEFQRRCLGRMGAIAEEGRTVLLVSHNMGAVSRLCTSGLLIRDGVVAYRGGVDETISRYLSTASPSGDSDLSQVADRTGNGAARFIRAATRNGTGQVADTFNIGDDLVFELTMLFPRPVRQGRMSLEIISGSGISVYHLVAVDSAFELNDLEGEVVVRVTLTAQKLYPGEYYVSLWLADSSYEALDRVPRAFKFMVGGGGSVVVRQLDRSSAVVHEIAAWERVR